MKGVVLEIVKGVSLAQTQSDLVENHFGVKFAFIITNNNYKSFSSGCVEIAVIANTEFWPQPHPSCQRYYYYYYYY